MTALGQIQWVGLKLRLRSSDSGQGKTLRKEDIKWSSLLCSPTTLSPRLQVFAIWKRLELEVNSPYLIIIVAFLFHELKHFTFKHTLAFLSVASYSKDFHSLVAHCGKAKYLCLSLSPAVWFAIFLLEVVKAHYAWTVTARRQSIKIIWHACDSSLSSSELLFPGLKLLCFTILFEKDGRKLAGTAPVLSRAHFPL